jgi:hypothetical protein
VDRLEEIYESLAALEGEADARLDALNNYIDEEKREIAAIYFEIDLLLKEAKEIED